MCRFLTLIPYDSRLTSQLHYFPSAKRKSQCIELFPALVFHVPVKRKYINFNGRPQSIIIPIVNISLCGFTPAVDSKGKST